MLCSPKTKTDNLLEGNSIASTIISNITSYAPKRYIYCMHIHYWLYREKLKFDMMWRQYSPMVNVYTSVCVLCLTYIYRGNIPLPQCICYKNKYITTFRFQLKEISKLISTDILLIMRLETNETLNAFHCIFCFIKVFRKPIINWGLYYLAYRSEVNFIYHHL